MRRRIMVFILALFSSVGAQANSITIGQFQFLGTNPQGVSAFKVILDTTGVTASPIVLQDLKLIVKQHGENTGVVSSPVAILFLAGSGFRLPACPCRSSQLDLFFPTEAKVFTFELAEGGLFTTNARPKFVLHPLPGQRFLSAGESVSIVLTSVPEPGTFILFSAGLLGLLYRRRCRPVPRSIATLLPVNGASPKT